MNITLVIAAGLLVAFSATSFAEETKGHDRISVKPQFRINGLDGAKDTAPDALGPKSKYLRYANGATLDDEGNIYVADSGNDRVVVFDSKGRFRFEFGENGREPGRLYFPMDVAVGKQDSDCRLFVADAMNNRVQVFSCEGKHIATIGQGDRMSLKGLNAPHGVAADSDGSVLVADTANHRVVRYSASGEEVAAWGSAGSGDGYFQFPHDLAVDKDGNVYVSDFANHRIQVFTKSGKFIRKWGGLGDKPGKFNHPWGVAVDNADRVWVVDMSNHRIQIFNKSGKFLEQFGTYQKIFGGGEAFAARIPLQQLGNITFDHPKGLSLSPVSSTTNPQSGLAGLAVISVPGAHSVDLYSFFDR